MTLLEFTTQIQTHATRSQSFEDVPNSVTARGWNSKPPAIGAAVRNIARELFHFVLKLSC